MITHLQPVCRGVVRALLTAPQLHFVVTLLLTRVRDIAVRVSNPLTVVAFRVRVSAVLTAPHVLLGV